MRAIVQDRYGPPDVLELREVERPAVGDGDVLVRVHAASVNPQDWHLMRASPFVVRMSGTGLRTPKTPIRGTDAAGQIEAVGRNVARLQPGDEVFGWCEGAFAEYVCADESHFVPKPADLSFEGAATLALAGCTALQGLRDTGALQPGQEVLIIGAGGGVGTFAVQIAKAFGARVTGVCSTTKMDLVRSLGADEVIDYTREDFTRGQRRYDLIFQLAGTASPSACRRALTPNGTLVLEQRRGPIRRNRPRRAGARLVTVRAPAAASVPHEGDHRDLLTLAELVAAGKVTPVIDRTYPLSRGPRGDLVSGGGTRSREGRHHGVRN